MPLLIGTRGSRLALAQTARVCALLEKEGISAETVVITTRETPSPAYPSTRSGGRGYLSGPSTMLSSGERSTRRSTA